MFDHVKFGVSDYAASKEFFFKALGPLRLAALFAEKHRAPAHLRHELDFSFRIEGQSVEFFEVRPSWQDKTKKLEHPVVKATYNKSKKTWRVFWRRVDGKWHSYPPSPEVATFEEFLDLVGEDEHACFFG